VVAFLFSVVSVTSVVKIPKNMRDESIAAHYEAGRCDKVLQTVSKHCFSG